MIYLEDFVDVSKLWFTTYYPIAGIYPNEGTDLNEVKSRAHAFRPIAPRIVIDTVDATTDRRLSQERRCTDAGLSEGRDP